MHSNDEQAAPDTITIVVPVVGPYASTNDVASGFGGAKKSSAYLELFRGCRRAAQREVERVGWTPASYRCKVEIVRYTRSRGMKDAGNVGKVELDALSPSTPKQSERDNAPPFAGLWTNDQLARPFTADIEYDPEGMERVVIHVRRRFPDPLTLEPQTRPWKHTSGSVAQPSGRRAKRAQEPATAAKQASAPVAAGGMVATCNGKPIAREDALKMIFGTDPAHRRAGR